jgi:polysaccharide biosynthesis protein PslJ
MRLDGAGVVGVLIVGLYALPATLIVPGLTYAGRPALLLALGLLAWWLLARLSPWLPLGGPQPLRWACLAVLVSALLSYLAGVLRGLPTVEANGQDFTVLVTLEILGLILMTADGVADWERLGSVLRVFVWSAAFVALIAITQSTFAFDLTHYLVLPGLEFKADPADFQLRGDSGLFRVAGTTTHYIEFSTVMALAAPFAVHLARFAPTPGARRRYLALSLLIVGVIPLAISRTGLVALVAGAAVMFVTVWDWRTRYNITVLAVAVTVGLFLVKPGLLGTLTAMFLWFDSDPSIEGRTGDYERIGYWFAQRPLLGRGPGTFIPDLYLILDNQWLYTLVTQGIVGVVALVALHLTCLGLATVALRRSAGAEDRHLCAALVAVQVMAVLVAATFDSLSFTTFTFTLAFLSGLCGAVWRLTHPARAVRTAAVRTPSRRPDPAARPGR